MAKTNKLYISYSPADNRKKDDQDAWVDSFISFLDIFLKRINKESPQFIPIHDKSGKAPSALEDGDGLIIILSENYIKESLHKKDSVLLTDPSKVFKVDMMPIRKSAQPKDVRYLNDFHFFENALGKKGGFVTMNSKRSGQNYWLMVIDLAFEISNNVFHKRSGSQEERKVIFLSETSYDQVGNRGTIKRELLRHGFKVIPETPFSGNLKEFEEQVKDCLKRADITVQIIGEEYGEIPDGSDKSIVEIQNNLATEYYQKNLSSLQIHLQRLIWKPLFLNPKTDQQKLYLDRLNEDILSTEGAEIIQTPLEILKTIIHSRLQILDKEKQDLEKSVEKRSERKSVYLIFDKKDENEINDIVNAFNSKNISVILSNFKGKQIELLKFHRESLMHSDSVFLYANKNLNWLNSKLNDVTKAPGFGKHFPFEAKAVYIKNSSVPQDKISNLGDIIVFNGDASNKTPTDLGPFIDKITTS